MEAGPERLSVQGAPRRVGLASTAALAVVGVLVVAALIYALVRWSQGAGSGPESRRTTNQIVILDSAETTNRFGDILICTVVVQFRDDKSGPEGALKRRWMTEEGLALLRDAVIDTIQDIDLASPRPNPKDVFEEQATQRLGELMSPGEESVVDCVLVTQWVAQSSRRY